MKKLSVLLLFYAMCFSGSYSQDNHINHLWNRVGLYEKQPPTVIPAISIEILYSGHLSKKTAAPDFSRITPFILSPEYYLQIAETVGGNYKINTSETGFDTDISTWSSAGIRIGFQPVQRWSIQAEAGYERQVVTADIPLLVFKLTNNESQPERINAVYRYNQSQLNASVGLQYFFCTSGWWRPFAGGGGSWRFPVITSGEIINVAGQEFSLAEATPTKRFTATLSTGLRIQPGRHFFLQLAIVYARSFEEHSQNFNFQTGIGCSL